MKEQKIRIFVESMFKKSKWCKEILKGIETCAVKQKLKYEIINGEDLIPGLLRQNEIIALLGTSEAWFGSFLSEVDFFEKKYF